MTHETILFLFFLFLFFGVHDPKIFIILQITHELYSLKILTLGLKVNKSNKEKN